MLFAGIRDTMTNSKALYGLSVMMVSVILTCASMALS
ncbi:hypothetical protein SHIRM173S_09841 [Streptomyces hirsutus]